MEYYRETWRLHARPERELKVIIVGAGIAGLSAGIGLRQIGHSVTIVDRVREITEVGAGMQMAPNNMRILGRFGVLPAVAEHCNFIQEISLRRWQNNEELGTAPLMPGVAGKYGAPLGVIHRADLQRILLEAAKNAGIDIRTDHSVVKADDQFEARVQLKNGEWLEGDLVIAADGIKSVIRRQIIERRNQKDHVTPTGDAAFRVLIPKERMAGDEGALGLLNRNAGTRWMGPGGHIMGYPIRDNQVYNMVLLHPDKHHVDAQDGEFWTRKGDKREMMDVYKDWCPEVRNLLSHVPEGEILEWTLNSHHPLPSWSENKVVLIGDSCHPMLPYVAQGAAQAIEDAGVLQCVLAKCSADVPLALAVYESVRKARGEAIQGSAAMTRGELHLPDGPAQQERDRKIREASQGTGDNPDLWADQAFQEFMWGTDVMKDTIVRWPEHQARARWTHLYALTPVACG